MNFSIAIARSSGEIHCLRLMFSSRASRLLPVGETIQYNEKVDDLFPQWYSVVPIGLTWLSNFATSLSTAARNWFRLATEGS